MGKISEALEKSKRVRQEAPASAVKKADPPESLSRSEQDQIAKIEPPPIVLPVKDTQSPKDENAVKHGASKNAISKRRIQAPAIVSDKLVVHSNPHSYEAEQFRKLRTNLLFPQTGSRPNSILVTSSVPGEGKSFIAANLAAATAQSLDNFVLLVDCDIRRPTLHSYFGYERTRGLRDYLLSDIPLSDLILNTKVDRLSILPAGETPKNPSELLSSKKMGALLDEITQRYDDRIIIIDSPPPRMTSETNALSRWVDGILLVVKFRTTNQEMVGEMVEMLGKEKIIGVVGNFLDIKTFSYSGKTKYTSYGRYYGSRD